MAEGAKAHDVRPDVQPHGELRLKPHGNQVVAFHVDDTRLREEGNVRDLVLAHAVCGAERLLNDDVVSRSSRPCDGRKVFGYRLRSVGKLLDFHRFERPLDERHEVVEGRGIHVVAALVEFDERGERSYRVAQRRELFDRGGLEHVRERERVAVLGDEAVDRVEPRAVVPDRRLRQVRLPQVPVEKPPDRVGRVRFDEGYGLTAPAGGGNLKGGLSRKRDARQEKEPPLERARIHAVSDFVHALEFGALVKFLQEVDVVGKRADVGEGPHGAAGRFACFKRCERFDFDPLEAARILPGRFRTPEKALLEVDEGFVVLRGTGIQGPERAPVGEVRGRAVELEKRLP